jgi:predicted RNA-binding protein with PUA-like domain
MNYWLVKSEPTTYSFQDLMKDKKTCWDGVRNFAARLHLRAMKKGDLVMFYHSNEDMAVIGIAKVSKTAYPDPTAKEGDWTAVDLIPYKPLKTPVTLAQIKAEKKLQNTALVRIGRLSVMPLTEAEFNLISAMGEVK